MQNAKRNLRPGVLFECKKRGEVCDMGVPFEFRYEGESASWGCFSPAEHAQRSANLLIILVGNSQGGAFQLFQLFATFRSRLSLAARRHALDAGYVENSQSLKTNEF